MDFLLFSSLFFSKTKNIAKLNGLLHIQDAQDLAQDDKYAEMLRPCRISKLDFSHTCHLEHPGYVVNFLFRL